MKTINEIRTMTGRPEYGKAFWNAMKTRGNDYDAVLNEGLFTSTSSYFFPNYEDGKFKELLKKYGIIRSIASGFERYKGGVDLLSANSTDYAEFISEGGSVPGFNVKDDFEKITVQVNTLVAMLKMPVEFAYDAQFDLKGYLIERMAKTFARAEDKAFITGTGEDEPVGILDDTAGADTGVTVSAITFDSIIDLFFSVDKDFRKNGVWIMNDKTALTLRKLKDDDGNYLWNHANDTILGKPVYISGEMPDADAGEKPVAFGDLSYYWIIDRSPASIKPLNELFTLNGQVGYIGYELLDGKLIRSDAVKVLEIETEE